MGRKTQIVIAAGVAILVLFALGAFAYDSSQKDKIADGVTVGGVDVGGMNMVPYARSFNETDTRITLNQRVRAVRRENGRLLVEVGSDHSPVRHTRSVDAVVVDHGVLANDELYHAMLKGSCNGGEVDYSALMAGKAQPLSGDGYQLFRVGDAVAGRNIHAAIYDALRLCKDL